MSQQQDHFESAQKTTHFPREFNSMFQSRSNAYDFENPTSRLEKGVSDRLSDLNQVDDDVFALSDKNSKLSQYKLSI